MPHWIRRLRALAPVLLLGALIAAPYAIIKIGDHFKTPPDVYRHIRTVGFDATCHQLGIDVRADYNGRAQHILNETKGSDFWTAIASRESPREELLDLSGRYFPPTHVHFWDTSSAFGEHVVGDTFQLRGESNIGEDGHENFVPMECEIRVTCSVDGRGCGAPEPHTAR